MSHYLKGIIGAKILGQFGFETSLFTFKHARFIAESNTHYKEGKTFT